jgi:hypothetical protein
LAAKHFDPIPERPDYEDAMGRSGFSAAILPYGPAATISGTHTRAIASIKLRAFYFDQRQDGPLEGHLPRDLLASSCSGRGRGRAA